MQIYYMNLKVLCQANHRMEQQGGKDLKKNDFILICTLVCIAVLIIFCQYLNKEDGNQVVITVDGEVYEILNLTEDNEVKIETEDGHYNILQIKDGKANMTESDCENQVCVNSATISNIGETIVCLPHRVIVKIVSSENQ